MSNSYGDKTTHTKYRLQVDKYENDKDYTHKVPFASR
jgi:hypothetical protein